MKYLLHLSLGKCLGLFLCFSWLSYSLSARSDSLLNAYVDSLEISEAEAATGLMPGLEELDAARKMNKIASGISLYPQQFSIALPNPKKIKKFKANFRPISSSKELSKKKVKKQKVNKTKKKRLTKSKKRRAWWRFDLHLKKLFVELLDLDWLLVVIVTVLPALAIAGLYILLGGMALSFFEMLIFALGFGFSIFSYIFIVSEYGIGYGAYVYYVKYGIATWPGIFALLAGFSGLFGFGGSFGGFFLIGLIFGGISFIVSLIVGDSFLPF